MNVINYKEKFVNNKKLYSAKDILEDFSKYMGMDVNEFKNLFSNYEVIDFSSIEEYIIKNEGNMWENRYDIKDITSIIKVRKRDYVYLNQKLALIAHKALNYLMLLEYIASNSSVFLEDKWFEMILERLEIYHFSRVMKGETINELLGSLYNMKNVFLDTLEQVNCLESYDRQILSDFFLCCGERGICRNNTMSSLDCVISYDSTDFNKTSLMRIRRKNGR